MRTILTITLQIAAITILLPCAPAPGAEKDIQVFSTAKTNASGRIFIKDVFARDGQTNLVRTATVERGMTTNWIHKFYRDGALVGEYWDMQDSSGFVTQAKSPFQLMGKTWATNGFRQVFICTNGRVVVDYFCATNGAFYPASSSAVREANKMTAEMSKLMSPPAK